MGRPPKPIERHHRIGSYRPDRHGNDHPRYDPGEPDPPGWLLPDAREHWDHLVGLLAGSGVLAEAHGIALALLANTLARYTGVSDLIEREGEIVIDKAGNVRRHPATMVLSTLHDQTLALLREFGLTPASVGRVSAHPPGDGGSPMESLLRIAAEDER